jgi:hypothetical protein
MGRLIGQRCMERCWGVRGICEGSGVMIWMFGKERSTDWARGYRLDSIEEGPFAGAI